jgi:hypothetical protein
MRDDLVVRTDVLRRAAGELTGVAYRLGNGLAGMPGLTVPTPDWATARALATVESAAHGWLGAVGGDLAGLATAARTAADEYDDADQRAAQRLSGLGR